MIALAPTFAIVLVALILQGITGGFSRPRLTPDTPLDPATLLGDAGDMAAKMSVERLRQRDEGEVQTVVDHGEPA
jgi:hypothetical protein